MELFCGKNCLFQLFKFYYNLTAKLLQEADPIVEIIVDNNRKLLYTLSEKSTIEAWKYGENNEMSRLAKVTQNEITRSATNIIR